MNTYLTYWSSLVATITFVSAAWATQTDYENSLPRELRSLVIQHIISGQDAEEDLKELLSCRLISKRYKQACDNPSLWLRFLPMLRLNTSIDSTGAIRISDPSKTTLKSSADSALNDLTPLVKEAIQRKKYTPTSLWVLYRMAEISLDPNYLASIQVNNNQVLSRLEPFSQVRLSAGGVSLNDLLITRSSLLSTAYKKRIAESQGHAKYLVGLAKEEAEEHEDSDKLLSDIDSWDNMQTAELNRTDQMLNVLSTLQPDTFIEWKACFEVFVSVEKTIDKIDSDCRDLEPHNAKESDLEWPG